MRKRLGPCSTWSQARSTQSGVSIRKTSSPRARFTPIPVNIGLGRCAEQSVKTRLLGCESGVVGTTNLPPTRRLFGCLEEFSVSGVDPCVTLLTQHLDLVGFVTNRLSEFSRSARFDNNIGLRNWGIALSLTLPNAQLTRKRVLIHSFQTNV